MVENLLNAYKYNPALIYFCRGHRMKTDENGLLVDYNNWDWCISDFQINKYNFPTGVAGCLYPPHCLHTDVTDKSLFMTFAPKADDVWFKAMALLNGTLSQKVYTHNSNGVDYIDLNGEAQTKTALFNTNGSGENDEQIKTVFERYNLYDKLK
jgi:hypothetical protein